jgi:hypothetical protein
MGGQTFQGFRDHMQMGSFLGLYKRKGPKWALHFGTFAMGKRCGNITTGDQQMFTLLRTPGLRGEECTRAERDVKGVCRKWAFQSLKSDFRSKMLENTLCVSISWIHSFGVKYLKFEEVRTFLTLGCIGATISLKWPFNFPMEGAMSSS